MIVNKTLGRVLVAGALATGIALAGCSAGDSNAVKTDDTTQSADGDATQEDTIPNPVVDIETAQKAAEGAGLESFHVPKSVTVNGQVIPSSGYHVVADAIAEAEYKTDGSLVVIRKGHPLDGEDSIAGDNNEYKKSWKMDTDGTVVTCHGQEDGKPILVEWEDSEGISYSLASYGAESEGQPMLEDEVAMILHDVK